MLSGIGTAGRGAELTSERVARTLVILYDTDPDQLACVACGGRRPACTASGGSARTVATGRETAKMRTPLAVVATEGVRALWHPSRQTERFMLVMLRFSWTAMDRRCRHCPLAHPPAILQARRHDQVLRGQSARRPRNSREATMALDPASGTSCRPSKKLGAAASR
jgi:hypothetical protein